MKNRIKMMFSVGCLAAAMFIVPSQSLAFEGKAGVTDEVKKSKRGDFLKGPKVDRDKREGRDFRGRKQRGMMDGKNRRGDRRGSGEKLLKELNLTKEQKAELHKLHEANKAEMKKFMASHKKEIEALKGKMAAARKSGDKKAMKALKEERKTLFKDAPGRTNRMDSLKSVLTSTQLGTLEKKIAERKAEYEKRKKEAKGKGRKSRGDDKADKKDKSDRKDKKARGRRRGRGGDEDGAEGSKRKRRGDKKGKRHGRREREDKKDAE